MHAIYFLSGSNGLAFEVFGEYRQQRDK